MTEYVETEDEEIEEAPTSSGPDKILMTIAVDAGQESIRIDKFIFSKTEAITRTKIQNAIDEGTITVNGEQVRTNYKVRPLDEIIIMDTRDQAPPTEIIPEEMDLDIVYEDDYLLIVNKPAGMVVHPGHGNYSGTLVNGLAHYLHKDEETLPRIGLVHRIDKDTTGLLVIAKDEKTLLDLQRQFKNHTVHRRYQALVWGDVTEEEGTVNVTIGRHPRNRLMMQAFADGEEGKEAITHYTILERMLYCTLLEYRLETGRTHQIRVHSRHIGHPLFGDAMYGGDKIVKGTVYGKYKQFVENNFKMLPRQALHAKELGFIHPGTGKEVLFNSEIPEDMAAVIERWRKYAVGRG